MEAGGDAAGGSADKLGGEKVVHAASSHCVVAVSDVTGVGGCWLWWSKWNTGLGERAFRGIVAGSEGNQR